MKQVLVKNKFYNFYCTLNWGPIELCEKALEYYTYQDCKFISQRFPSKRVYRKRITRK